MNKITVGEFQVFKRNKLAGLYPTCKLVLITLYLVVTVIMGTLRFTSCRLPLLLIPETLFFIPLNIKSGVLKKSWFAFKTIFIIVLCIFLVQTFLVAEGRLVSSWWIFKIHSVGLQTGLTLALYIFHISMAFIWFFQTTQNKEIVSVLESKGVNRKVIYLFLSSLQMIDVFTQKSQTIMNAQSARGIETQGNFFIRSKAFIPVIIPLLLNGIIDSAERALTLEVRGFEVDGPKTSIIVVEKNGYERISLMVFGGITVLVVCGRFLLWVL